MTTHQVILIFIPAITWFSFNQQMLDIVTAPLSMFSLGRQMCRWCYMQYSSRRTNNVHIKDPTNTTGWAQHTTPQTNRLWKWNVLLKWWEIKWYNMVPRPSWALQQTVCEKKTFITPDTIPNIITNTHCRGSASHYLDASSGDTSVAMWKRLCFSYDEKSNDVIWYQDPKITFVLLGSQTYRLRKKRSLSQTHCNVK